jgi:hypothetical protein
VHLVGALQLLAREVGEVAVAARPAVALGHGLLDDLRQVARGPLQRRQLHDALHGVLDRLLRLPLVHEVRRALAPAHGGGWGGVRQAHSPKLGVSGSRFDPGR